MHFRAIWRSLKSTVAQAQALKIHGLTGQGMASVLLKQAGWAETAGNLKTAKVKTTPFSSKVLILACWVSWQIGRTPGSISTLRNGFKLSLERGK